MVKSCDKVEGARKRKGQVRVKQLFKIIPKCLVWLIICSLLGFALVYGAYALPERTIIYNASVSTDFLVSNYISKDTVWMNWADYFTDVVMLNIASFHDEGATVFHRAVTNEKIGNTFDIVRWLSERTSIAKTYYSFEEGEALNEVTTYGKYWNGYLILLRPMLLYFSMRQIYTIFRILLAVFFGITVLLLLIKDARFALPFVLSFLSFHPFSKFCFSYSVIEILLCIFMCVLILCKGLRESNSKVMIFFFVQGIVANYFTLMQFSFAIALFCAVFTAYSVPGKQGVTMQKAKLMISLLLCYAFGYCAMWMVKWIIILLFDRNSLSEVIYSISLRLSHEDNGEKVTLSEALLWNICGFYYKNKALMYGVLLLGLEAVASVMLHVLKKRNIRDIDLDEGLLPIIIVAATVIRYALVLNHSKIHYFFMNRLFSGVLFVFLSAGATYVFRKNSDNQFEKILPGEKVSESEQ